MNHIMISLEEAKRKMPEHGFWPEPDLSLTDNGRSKPPVLPLEPFGTWVTWIKAHAECKSAPADYVAMALLSVASSLIGNARHVSPWSGWKEPAPLWIANVGNPSSGKSPAMDAALDPLRILQDEMAAGFVDESRLYERDLEAAKAARDAWQDEVKTAVKNGVTPPELPEAAVAPGLPIRPRLFLVDATVEMIAQLLAAHRKGLLFTRDELSGWLGNFDRYGGGGGDRAFWIESFGGRPYIVDRVKHGQDPIRIPHLSLSICGGIQPDRLASLLMRGDDDGLASRFLMSWPNPVPPLRPRGSPDDRLALMAMRRLMNLNMGTDTNGEPCPTVIHLSSDAAKLFQSWREDNAKHEFEVNGLLLSHFGKMPGLVLRLALALEYLSWSMSEASEPTAINMRSVGYAAHLVDEYFKPMARRVYGDAALPEADRDATAIAKRIMRDRPEIVNASEIRREWKIPGLKTAPKVKAGIEVMEEAGWLSFHPSRDGITPGRGKENYLVNPRLYEAQE